MKKFNLFLLSFLLAACGPASGGSSGTVTVVPLPVTPTEEPVAVSKPFPQHVEYASGSILPNHRTQGQLDDDVRAFYDYWKSEYLIQDGASEDGYPLYRGAFGRDLSANGTTVCEGQATAC